MAVIYSLDLRSCHRSRLIEGLDIGLYRPGLRSSSRGFMFSQRDLSSIINFPLSVIYCNKLSSFEAWDSSSVEAWDSSRVVAWDSSRVEAWDSSSVEAREYAAIIIRSLLVKAISKCKTAKIIISIYKSAKTLKQWLDRHNIKPSASAVILFKKVSDANYTQENTRNQTHWQVGKTLTHPAWSPENNECGEGKYHACARPYFCDEFRNVPGDKYIAVKIALKDLYLWRDNPHYPHKIGFRKGKVLYECDRDGNKVEH